MANRNDLQRVDSEKPISSSTFRCVWLMGIDASKQMLICYRGLLISCA